jgi:hypothetical protein
MGASLVYLDKPNKDISHEEGEDGQLSFVASEMQGWRINMVSPMHPLPYFCNAWEIEGC